MDHTPDEALVPLSSHISLFVSFKVNSGSQCRRTVERGHWIPSWGCLPADRSGAYHWPMVAAACFLTWISAALRASWGLYYESLISRGQG